ncbi:hypothetical protein F5Y14DRAFT_421979 [Nemania sp. NC0429]|nr:hypothetical protein F5Y14DRAFT_421979 [Nemania sp. NC0429]
MQASSPLFSLPSEVRDNIYDFYLTYDDSDFNDSLRPRDLYLDDVYSRPLPALMRSCKQAYQEISPKVHEQAAMRVVMRGQVITNRRSMHRIGFAVHGTLRFDRLRTLFLLVPLEYPLWNKWLGFFSDVVRRAPRLRVLVVDWAPRPLTDDGATGRVSFSNEDDFFDIIARLTELHKLYVYGDISARWIDKLTNLVPRMVHYRSRWWREAGTRSDQDEGVIRYVPRRLERRSFGHEFPLGHLGHP